MEKKYGCCCDIEENSTMDVNYWKKTIQSREAPSSLCVIRCETGRNTTNNLNR